MLTYTKCSVKLAYWLVLYNGSITKKISNVKNKNYRESFKYLESGGQARPKSIGFGSRTQSCWILLGSRAQHYGSKEKKLKALGPARGRIHVDGSCSQQEQKLMGPAAARSKAILDLYRTGPNSNGSYWARPNLIYSPWV